jgi:hypothetical protein
LIDVDVLEDVSRGSKFLLVQLTPDIDQRQHIIEVIIGCQRNFLLDVMSKNFLGKSLSILCCLLFYAKYDIVWGFSWFCKINSNCKNNE